MKKTTAIILILFSFAFILSCRGMIGKVRTSLVTVTVGKNGAALLEIKPATPVEKAKRFLARIFSTAAANAAIPSIVQDLRLTVSADDMATITATAKVAGLESADFVVVVPNGPQRRFLVEGLDSASTVQYSGEAVSDLTGAPVALTISMAVASQGPLIVVSTQPADGAIDVPVDAAISALFSKPIEILSIDSTSFIVKDNAGAPVSGSLLASGSTATFTPAAPLTHGARYTAAVTTGVKDLAGNALAADFTWSFTTAADSVPPVFAGLSLVSNLSITAMQLSWSPATDNATPTSNMVYLIYQATSAGGENFASATFTTAPGATSFTVTGLTPGVTYYFNVRAKDEAGNTDANVVESSQTYPGRYVSSSGVDNPLCSQSAPCLTIAKAQSLTAINEGIFVSAGTFSIFSTLTLTTGSALACTGPNHTTVINTQGAVAPATITGSQGVVIDGCKIVDVDGAAPMIQDNGTDILVDNCILQGITNASSLGVALSGNSTVQNSTISNFIFNAGAGDAISVSGGSALISNNTFTANFNAITTAAGAGSPTISNNILTGNSTGINVGGGSPTITGNIIGDPSVKNSVGVNITAGTPSISNNSIFCSLNADLQSSITIAVPNNSWDHDPPNPQSGSVSCVTAGIDICALGAVPPSVAASPASPAVTNGCTP